MSQQDLGIGQSLDQYTQANWLRESRVAAALRKATLSTSVPNMQISPQQGQTMAFLVKILNTKHCLEIGTFTGYSALMVAEALPSDGRLIACDISTQYTDIGKPFWEEAGVSDRIDLRIGPALDTLDELIAGGHSGLFDFSFVDADK